jgi:CheY-like chemotaxis protein
MPDALMIKPMGATSASIEEACRQHDLRLKEVNSFSIAKEWLGLREFDLIFVHSAYSDADRDAFAGLAWRQTPLTYLVVFDLEASEAESEQDGRLAGYEVALGSHAVEVIEDIISRIKTLRDRGNDVPEVMVVEDLDSPRDIICSYVESLGGCRATGMPSAMEALKELEADPDRWACVITDMRMPRVDGKELIEMVRRHRKLQHLPVIVLTAYGTLDTLVDCLKAGASGFMVKPPRKQDLIRELSRALRILEFKQSPRLATEGDVEVIQEELLKKHGGGMV